MISPYSTDYFPAAPTIEVNLSLPYEAFRNGPLLAFVDTGAGATIVPTRYLVELDAPIDNHKYARSQWGERRMVDIYVLDIGIGDSRILSVETIGDASGEEIVLGRDVLNKLILTLNGPKQFLELRA
ncbi:MAG: hypothetical protein HY872_04910 [Chloroflexi bacterium]|nr:hypothetical protein [Chloroflexota bacterium]MBI5829453.1 hypothetical protein [Chloroflexota bacterium]